MATRRDVVRYFGTSLAALATSSIASAETYPTHRVKIIATVAPGGTVDVLARLIAQKLSESFGQNFYVEDIPGGGGKMGAAAAARSAPDGYTILFVFNSFITDYQPAFRCSLRSAQRFCAGHVGGDVTLCAGGFPVPWRSQRAGITVAGEGESRQVQLCRPRQPR